MGRYYARNGDEITLEQWAELLARDEYRIVEQTHISWMWVSTVWLGLDMNIFGGLPLIFETMAFDVSATNPWVDMDAQRYFTEEQARRGHQEMVDRVRGITDEIESIPQQKEET